MKQPSISHFFKSAKKGPSEPAKDSTVNGGATRDKDASPLPQSGPDSNDSEQNRPIDHQRQSAGKQQNGLPKDNEQHILPEHDNLENQIEPECDLRVSEVKQVKRLSVDPSGSKIKRSKESKESSSGSVRTSFEGNEELDDAKETKRKSSESSRSSSLSSKTSSKPAKRKNLTPLERQIQELREKHKDKLLLWQIGYKYKAFGEDARICAQLLDIMFIEGGDGGERSGEFSYCSFPDFKLHINLMRILERGHKVAIVKQVESSVVMAGEKELGKAHKSKAVMERDVVAVYTKGTYLGDESDKMVNENDGSYIVCLCGNTIVAVQPSTGEVVYDTEQDLETRLMYLHPSEVIILKKAKDTRKVSKTIRLINPNALVMEKTQEVDLTPVEDIPFLSSFDGSVKECIAVLMAYLEEFRLSSIFTIQANYRAFSTKTQMVLPGNALHALDIFANSSDGTTRGSLVWLLDHTRTKFGQRQLHKWISQPLICKEKIEERHEAIEAIISSFHPVVDAFKGVLDKIGKQDLEQMLIKIHYSVGSGTPKISRGDVYHLLECFQGIIKLSRDFAQSIAKFGCENKSVLLTTLFSELSDLASADIVANFMRMVDLSYIIDSKKSPEEQKTSFFDLSQRDWPKVSAQKHAIEDIERQLDEELANIRTILNRPGLTYITNNKEPYLVEVRNGKAVDALPSDWHRINGTQSVSRFRTATAARLYKLLQYHQELLLVECDSAFHQFLAEMDENYDYFCRIVRNLASLDCLLSLAAAASVSPSAKPLLVDHQCIEVVQGRNPIAEHLTGHYVPNDVHMGKTSRAHIITGPNMGGKSSYVKQITLLVIMNQIGCFLPCSSAKLGIFDSVFVRMGASDDILRGMSTFMTEMLECANIVNAASPRSLIVLDEIGRGTGTTDGIALAYSILDYLVSSSCNPLVLFITHYPSLSVLADKYPEVRNYHMGFEMEGDAVVFLYSVVHGVADNSYGLNVARMAGIPESVIEVAKTRGEEMRQTTNHY